MGWTSATFTEQRESTDSGIHASSPNSGECVAVAALAEGLLGVPACLTEQEWQACPVETYQVSWFNPV
jgi:hypothetical protein